MTTENWIQLALLLSLTLIIVFYAIRKFKRDKENGKIPNFKQYFFIGIICIPISLVIKNLPLTVMGLILAILGLANRKYWIQTIPWSELDPQQRKIRIIISILSIIILVIGVLGFLYISNRFIK